MNHVKKVFFIVNKYSGTGLRADFEQMIADACKVHHAKYAIEYTLGREHATQLASEAGAAGFQKIVAVGGDGTVNEVAQALVSSPLTMGIIPKGSGNGLARHLGISVRIDQALHCVFTGKMMAMDTFRINGKLSLNVSGIGFDGYVANLFDIEGQRGLQGYTKLVLNEYMQFREFEAALKIDDRVMERKAFVIAIANSSQYGNNAKIAPTASVCDQLLNISILKKFPPYRLDFIYSFFSGAIDQSAYCESLQIRNASIRLKEPMDYHVDGEPAGKAGKFTIELLPASLQILAPALGRY